MPIPCTTAPSLLLSWLLSFLHLKLVLSVWREGRWKRRMESVIDFPSLTTPTNGPWCEDLDVFIKLLLSNKWYIRQLKIAFKDVSYVFHIYVTRSGNREHRFLETNSLTFVIIWKSNRVLLFCKDKIINIYKFRDWKVIFLQKN